jgi:hypothetical protein
MQFSDYKVHTQDVSKYTKAIQAAFEKKRELEKRIVRLIKDFEIETGLAIDTIKYQRDITLPIRGPKYTDLTILVAAEEDLDEIKERKETDGKEGTNISG